MKYINLKLYGEGYPIFNESNINFMRDEKSGYKLIYIENRLFLNEVTINPTAFKMLSLCNGNRNIENIIDELKNVFLNVSEEVLKEDLQEVLCEYTRLDLVRWKDEVNPFMQKYNRTLNENLKLEIASESNTRELIDFFKNQKKLDYINPGRVEVEYVDEVILRQKLFLCTEEFVLLKNNSGEIKGVISALIPAQMKSTTASIGVICMPIEWIENAVKFLIETLLEVAVVKIRKIKYQSYVEKEDVLKKFFLNNLFISEGILQKEYDDQDIEVISYIFRGDI